MRLLNADGSPSEISGNGLRCLAAWLAHPARKDATSSSTPTPAASGCSCSTGAVESLHLLAPRWGSPRRSTQEPIDVGGVDGRRRHAARRQSAVRGARRGHDRAAALAGGRARGPSAIPGRHERRARHRRGARSGPHSHLGARRRPDGSVGHRRVRVGRRRDRVRRRRACGRRRSRPAARSASSGATMDSISPGGRNWSAEVRLAAGQAERVRQKAEG